MGDVRQALKMQREAQRRRALAPEYDPVRRDFELGLADEMEREAQARLTPPKPLQKGLGGEIVPQVEDGLPGLESALQEPDLLAAEASRQRADLLERAGVLEAGIEAAEQVKAGSPVEKMLAHQMAAGHRRALELLAESSTSKDPEIAIKKVRTSARLMDAFARGALTLQRLQGGGAQTIQVQYVQVNAMVGDAAGKAQNPADVVNAPKNRGGRPPTNGYRTAKAIEERRSDRELLSSLNTIRQST